MRCDGQTTGASAASRGFAYSTIQLSKIVYNPEHYVLIFVFSSAENKNQSILMVEVNGIEPMASCVQGRRSPS